MKMVSKILVGVFATLGVTFVGLVISSLMMGYGPLTTTKFIAWRVLSFITSVV